jgi:hypothetical protein
VTTSGIAASHGDVTDEDLRVAVKEFTPAGTQEVTDCVGLSRHAVDHRPQQIEDRHANPGKLLQNNSMRPRFVSGE